MSYRILQSFKDGKDSYVQGETRHMEPEAAMKFARRGWVLVDGVTPDPVTGGTLTLEIHDGRLGHASEIL